MRVYEFAKQNGLISKEVIGQLKKAGIEVASHMSVLSNDSILLLQKLYSRGKIASGSAGQGVSGSQKKDVVKKIKKEGVVAGQEKKKDIPLRGPVVSELQKDLEKPSEKSKGGKGVVAVSEKPRRVRSGLRVVTEIKITQEEPLYRVAELLGRPVVALILALLKKGIICNRNHVLSTKIIVELAESFGVAVSLGGKVEEKRSGLMTAAKGAVDGGERWPIVAVMGHVDHGKTTLLDYIRKMNTAEKERGGITQHLAAYEVDGLHGKIIFLDTPGHEAFSYMRKRGASVTDIAVLVVAADDGVMPQTIEAIQHARESDVSVIVAINKIDKVADPTVAIENIKRQLAEQELLPEDWGGSVICVPISAKTGKGIEELLEMIVLQAQIMELKANPATSAKAFVLESRLEQGLGPVATVICLGGTIKLGDCFVCGSSTGKVRLLINCFGKRVSEAGPAVPVQVVGFDRFVSLGDWLTVVSSKAYLHEKALRKKDQQASFSSGVPIAAAEVAAGVVKEKVLLVIKADTYGSKEAVVGAIKKLNKINPKVSDLFQVIYSGVGDIAEGEVDLAAYSGARIIGLHVKAEKNALALAKERRVSVQTFDIIYRMIEDLEKLLSEHEEKKIVLKKTGEAIVRKVFDLGKHGVVAGCYVSAGLFSRNGKVVCYRGGQEMGGGKILSLQRERKVVKEVHAGYECGFVCDDFRDWRVEDMVHCFIEVTKKSGEI